MKLKKLLELNNQANQMIQEKKEAVGEVPLLNLTFHLDHKFSNVGDSGKPELSFTISISSTGGKEFTRVVSDKAEKEKFELAVAHEVSKAVNRLSKNMQYIVSKYHLKEKAQPEDEI